MRQPPPKPFDIDGLLADRQVLVRRLLTSLLFGPAPWTGQSRGLLARRRPIAPVIQRPPREDA